MLLAVVVYNLESHQQMRRETCTQTIGRPQLRAYLEPVANAQMVRERGGVYRRAGLGGITWRCRPSDDVAAREVTIMGDRDIPYRLLKKVMATCTGSDFGKISLAVMQKSSDELDRLQAARQ